MSLDKKDVAIACFVGIISWALLTHWIPTLRWIPHAFVAGALTTVLASTYLLLTSIQHHGRSNGPPEISPPVFIRPGLWQQEKVALRLRSTYNKKPVYPRSLPVSKAVDSLLDLVLRDFVTSWFKNISSKSLFQNEVDRAIRESIINIGARAAGLDIVEVAVARIVPIITAHVRDFSIAERTVRGKNLTRDMTESDELDYAIASKFRDGKLHPAASLAFDDTKPMQQSHLRGIVSRVLPLVLPENMTSSPAVLSLIREIVSCAVLCPIVLMLADPDTFNQMIEASVSRW